MFWFWSCRVARVCEELCPMVGVPHCGLADLWKECPRSPLWGSEEGAVLQAEGNGPIPGFEGLWGPAALCRGSEGRKFQAFGTAKAGVRPVHSRNASEHRQTDHNSGCCFKEEDNVWNSTGIHAKMMNAISAFLFYFLHHFLGLNDEYCFYFPVVSEATFSPSFLFDFWFVSAYSQLHARSEGTV